MSRFFHALQQAEQERALRQQTTAAPEADRPPGATDAAAAASAPVATAGPADGAPLEAHLVSLLSPASFAAEQYRTLRHLVEQFHKTVGLRVIAVSSPAVGDGKTTTAVNLAGALAQAPDARVMLVDADLRRSALARHFGLPNGDARGLVDAILDPALPLAAVVRRRPPFNLSIIAAGRQPTAPYEILKSSRFGDLLAQARTDYDYVILDTPPVVAVPDCRVIGKWVDGFLLVVAAHKTPRTLIEEALNIVDPAQVLGLVFNGDEHALSEQYPIYATTGVARGRRHLGRAVKNVRKLGGSLRGRIRNAETSVCGQAPAGPGEGPGAGEVRWP